MLMDTFIHTGFRPAWVMIKRTDATNYWLILDDTRREFNPNFTSLYPNLGAMRMITLVMEQVLILFLTGLNTEIMLRQQTPMLEHTSTWPSQKHLLNILTENNGEKTCGTLTEK